MMRQLYGRKILEHFQVTETDFLGAGGESRVYALDVTRILRIFSAGTEIEAVKMLKEFYDSLHLGELDFEIPRILEVGTIDHIHYSIEPRVSGKNLTRVLPKLSGRARSFALENYIRAAASVRRISVSADNYGEILVDRPVRANRWSKFLESRALVTLEQSKAYLTRDIPDLENLFHRWCESLKRLAEPSKSLVHGDFFPGNVMVNEAGVVNAIIDFSPMTVIGDWRMDLAGAVIFLEVTNAYQREDSKIAEKYIDRELGEDSTEFLELYRLYYSFYFSGCGDDSPSLYVWCIENLNRVCRDDIERES